MKNLLSLLERFSNSLNRDKDRKEIIAQIIKDKTQASIPADNISLNNGVLEITAGATLKNEISLKDALIKDALRERKVFVSRILYK